LVLTILTCGIYLYVFAKARKRALSLCGPSCARPQQAVAYLGWHGTVHQFEVTQTPFAHAFLTANAKKVVWADSAAQVLLASPRPSAPPMVFAPALVPPTAPSPGASFAAPSAVAPSVPHVAPPAASAARAPAAPAPVSAKPKAPVPVTAQPPPAPVREPKQVATPRGASPRTGFIGPDETIVVGGRTLIGPLAYVAPDERGADASTIVTSLRVRSEPWAEPLPYWPTYAGASAAQRAAYLDWHASGRSDAKIQIGYVFIHFYGLERRALVDLADHEVVHHELKRLLAIYGQQASFRGYASALMAFMTLPLLETMSEDVAYARLGEIAKHHPTALSALLGWFHLHKRPLPAPLAMHVASSMEGAKRGVAVTRARAELDDLFSIRYRERFGDGLVVDAAKRPEVVEYHPGSPSLLSARRPKVPIPYVLGRRSQFSPVVELWNACVADLRKLGTSRHGATDGPLTAEAWLALPPELRADYVHPDQEKWDTSISAAPRVGAFRIVTAGRLAALAGIEADDRVTSARLRRVADAAELFGYALEPDPRVHARTLAADVELAIWETDHAGPPDPKLWRSVHMMLSLAMSIAVADGNVSDEEAHTVHSLIANLFPLDDGMRTRVAALRQLLERNASRVTSIAKKLKESRTAAELTKIGRVLVTVAAVDGIITDGEHRALKSLYKAMGLSAAELAGAIAASGARLGADEPVSARAARAGAGGEPIPKAPEDRAPTLDRAAIAAILAETREVASILSDVLDDEDEDATPAEPAPRPPAPSAPSPIGPWSTLDARYHSVLRELLTRTMWTPAEIRALTSQSKLMPGAVLEAVNAWSEETFGDYVIEEAGDWKINAQLLEQATA
jgi:tellurite resistance protein